MLVFFKKMINRYINCIFLQFFLFWYLNLRVCLGNLSTPVQYLWLHSLKCCMAWCRFTIAYLTCLLVMDIKMFPLFLHGNHCCYQYACCHLHDIYSVSPYGNLEIGKKISIKSHVHFKLEETPPSCSPNKSTPSSEFSVLISYPFPIGLFVSATYRFWILIIRYIYFNDKYLLLVFCLVLNFVSVFYLLIFYNLLMFPAIKIFNPLQCFLCGFVFLHTWNVWMSETWSFDIFVIYFCHSLTFMTNLLITLGFWRGPRGRQVTGAADIPFLDLALFLDSVFSYQDFVLYNLFMVFHASVLVYVLFSNWNVSLFCSAAVSWMLRTYIVRAPSKLCQICHLCCLPLSCKATVILSKGDPQRTMPPSMLPVCVAFPHWTHAGHCLALGSTVWQEWSHGDSGCWPSEGLCALACLATVQRRGPETKWKKSGREGPAESSLGCSSLSTILP